MNAPNSQIALFDVTALDEKQAPVKHDYLQDMDLNIPEKTMNYVLCRGSNKHIPEIARLSGWDYGSRHDYTIYSGSVYMIDIRWKDYDWGQYIEKIKQYRPTIAMVADYEYPEQKGLMLKQIEELRPLVGRVMVCPKFLGAVADVPQDCIIAVSVISKYAGFEPPAIELQGRDIHLLGGNFKRQADMIRKYNAYGKVVSLDSASHATAAEHGRYFYKGKWHQTRQKEWDNNALAVLSGICLINWFEKIAKETQPMLESEAKS